MQVPWSSILGSIGRWAIGKFTDFMNIFAFSWRLLLVPLRERTRGYQVLRKTILQQIYFTGVEAFGVISIIALIMGAMIIIQATEQLQKVGGEDLLGTLLTVIIIREMGPLMTALIVILRSGVAVSIEMGYMSVLKEVQGIQMMGIDPLHILAIPRIIGITVAVICLFIYFDIVAIFGGWALGWAVAAIPFSSFFEIFTRTLSGWDVGVGFVKGLFFGLTIAVVCVYSGLRARLAITEVPQATSRAAVQSLIYCVVWDAIISAFFYI